MLVLMGQSWATRPGGLQPRIFGAGYPSLNYTLAGMGRAVIPVSVLIFDTGKSEVL